MGVEPSGSAPAAKPVWCVDADSWPKVRATLPHGVATVKAVLGGLDVPDQAGGDIAIIASAAVAVRLDLP